MPVMGNRPQKYAIPLVGTTIALPNLPACSQSANTKPEFVGIAPQLASTYPLIKH